MSSFYSFCVAAPENISVVPCVEGGEWNFALQYSCLGNPMDRGVWWATVYRVTKQSPGVRAPRLQTVLSTYYMLSPAKDEMGVGEDRPWRRSCSA